MPRARVLSFMSQWGGGNTPRSPPSSAPASPPQSPIPQAESPRFYAADTPVDSPLNGSPKPPRTDSFEKRHSRRTSMVMAYQPPVMEIAKDTLPELQPIFNHLNSHSNKLYQEGYFLKLHDLDSRGRPSVDRVWSECFAQLVGTVLSLWDAAQLDAAGDDGEVMPTFINMTDASIRMIESLPMNGADGQSLQNVLSISTAANNRYLLHFNSLHSLTQWTAGIRLAMFEHSCLQEAYTGSIIAGKGKHLNNIRSIMERARFPTEDWARVRFGAGTPWRRCWCVISPPDEKDAQKAQKQAKKRSAYEKAPVVKGDIKFYETRKITKKTKPIATIKDAFTAYALYPQSKELIDQSTLVKVDGTITIHSTPETTTEGFVFVMPEVHPALTGFEMMIRWLLPAFDAFALYGRPTRLIADAMDVRSLMFAMPSGNRYGHLDLIDVAGLIHTEGSKSWSEREWHKQLKNLTSRRMNAPAAGPNRTMSGDDVPMRGSSQANEATGRSSLNLPSSGGVRFANGAAKSTPGSRNGSPAREGMPFLQQQRNVSDSALAKQHNKSHQRTASDAYKPSRLSFETPTRDEAAPPRPPPHLSASTPPPPPQHGVPAMNQAQTQTYPGREQYQDPYRDQQHHPAEQEQYPPNGFAPNPPAPPAINEPLRPVAAPPSMAHKSNAAPPRRPAQMPEFRRANSAMDEATLAQLNDANPAGAQYRFEPHGPPPQMYNQGPPQQYNQGPPPGVQQYMPPSGGMRRNGPPSANFSLADRSGTFPANSNLPERRLPTIPGTPAAEHERFELGPPQQERSRSVPRKPLPRQG